MSVKNVAYVKKVYVSNLCSLKNRKYLASIMDSSAFMCDEVITTNFNEKKATCKAHNFYILLSFLLITIALLIAVSIYYYLIKYKAII